MTFAMVWTVGVCLGDTSKGQPNNQMDTAIHIMLRSVLWNRNY